MKAICPKDPKHNRFITSAHVVEDWLVDEEGNFIDHPHSACDEVLHWPDPGNRWTCKICGAEAKVVGR